MPKVSKLSRSSLTTNYLNPLNIPAIVKIIFNHVNSLTTLKNIRAVSKLWRWESMDQLKRNAVLFLNDETVEGLINAYLNKKDEELPEGDFKSFFYQISEKPFESYRVPYDLEHAFTSLPDLSSPLLKTAEALIWDVYFSRATFLDLGMIYFDNNTDIYAGFEELKWILKTCPRLKALDIDPHIIPEDNFEEEGNEALRQQDDFHYLWCSIRGNRALEAADAEGWGNDEILSPNLESLSVGKSFDAYESHCYSLLRKEGRAVTTFRRLFKGCPKLKNIWTHATNNLTIENSPVLKAATDNFHELESLTLVSLPWRESVGVLQVAHYVKTVRPPLKTLILTIKWSECLDRDLMNILKEISGTLTKLELFLDSNKPTSYPSVAFGFLDDPEKHKIDPTKTSGSQSLQFPNLTRFKISLCYTRFEGKGEDNLLSFEFRSFASMKKLKEFRYESGLNVEKSWVTKQVTIRDLPVSIGEGEEDTLPDLKLIHYHKRFSCDALQRLGKWMPGLETLEVVLDKATFPEVLKIWPGLKQITLLPCSNVPKKVIETTMGPVIVDQSKNYTPAERKSPDKTISGREECDHDRRRLSCFRTKAHKAINY